MSSPAGVPIGNSQLQSPQSQAPPAIDNNDASENGVTIRPMRRRYIAIELQSNSNAYSR
jgi:hypothetical protein